MSDKEMIRLAAKAAGHELCVYTDDGAVFLRGIQKKWDPLNDDGDALRLAVRLQISVLFWPSIDAPDVEAQFWKKDGENSRCGELFENDPSAATRRAIVRAAAEIGRSMP